MKSILTKIFDAVTGCTAAPSAENYRRLWEHAAASAYEHVVALQEMREKLVKAEEKAQYWERRWGEAGREHEEHSADLREERSKLIAVNADLGLALQEARVENAHLRKFGPKKIDPTPLQKFIDEYADDSANEETKPREVHLELKTPVPNNVVEVVYQLETTQALRPIVRAMQVEGMDQQNLDLWRLDPANTLAAQELISEAVARLARRGKEWFQEQNCYRFFVTRIAGISTWGGVLDNCVVVDEYFAEKENGEY